MATTTTETALFKGKRRSVWHITGENTDATGETAATKVDISTLVGPDRVNAPSKVTVEAIEYLVSGFNFVTLAWDHTSDVTIAHLAGSGEFNWVPVGGKHDTGSGGTGDIILTSDGAADGDVYDITIWLRHEV